MTTFRSTRDGFCSLCQRPIDEHAGPLAACPRDFSQPVSRVVAGPARKPIVGDRVRRLEDGVDGEVASIGLDVGRVEAVEVRRSLSTSIVTPLDGFADRWTWVEEPAPTSSLDADIAAFRALTAEQRAALLRIGGEADALLTAARDMTRARLPGMTAWAESEALRAVVDRIDARRR